MKWRVIGLGLLAVSLVSVGYFVAHRPPSDIVVKGPDDPTNWLALITAVVSLVGSILSFLKDRRR